MLSIPQRLRKKITQKILVISDHRFFCENVCDKRKRNWVPDSSKPDRDSV